MKRIAHILGIDLNRVSHAERLISGLGAFLGIFFVYLTSHAFIEGKDAVYIVASMGASAVMLFAVPHSQIAQPWSLVGGHVISALAGVTAAHSIDSIYFAAPIAVGLAVTLMHYLRCIHPPGGATALMAVIGGSSLYDLGYYYVLAPVLVNTLVILAVAIGYNALFPWRRYPAYFKRSIQPATTSATAESEPGSAIAHEDFVYALSQIDSFIDITEDDLLTIYQLATHHSEVGNYLPADLELGHYYSNGKYGDEWSVRQIIDWQLDNADATRSLIYKIVAGEGRRTTGVITLSKFARWVKHEVYRDEDNWRRVETTGEKH